MQMSLYLLCLDLSMRAPGFAVLEYDPDTKAVRILETSRLNHKGSKATHGQM